MLPQFRYLMRTLHLHQQQQRSSLILRVNTLNVNHKTRNLSSNNNLVPIVKKTSSSDQSSSSSKNPLTSVTKNVSGSITAVNLSIKQRYRTFKCNVRMFIIKFTITFLIIYAMIDHTIREIIYEFLKEQNLSSYITMPTITSTTETAESNGQNQPKTENKLN